MAPFELFLFGLLLVVAVASAYQVQAAYRNGVIDGYGFAKQPGSKHYRTAGRILREQWPDLDDEIEDGDEWKRG